jgi:hypothetical protein
MAINQLFFVKPSEDIVSKVCVCFGLSGVSDGKKFTKNDMFKIQTVNKLMDLVPELEEFYLPCKAKHYLYNFDENGALTILRQLLRTLEYKLVSKEKYLKSIKYIEYHIDFTNQINSPIIVDPCQPAVIDFKD